MDANELMLGNIVKREKHLINKWDKDKFNEIVVDKSDIYACVIAPDKFKSIRLTNEWLVKLGINPIPHFTVGYSHIIDIGRSRVLSFSSVGTPNEMVFLKGMDADDPKKCNELVCLHNYDYDGYLTVHKAQNIYYSLANKKLIIKENHEKI